MIALVIIVSFSSAAMASDELWWFILEQGAFSTVVNVNAYDAIVAAPVDLPFDEWKFLGYHSIVVTFEIT